MSDLDGSRLIHVDPLPMPFTRSDSHLFALRHGMHGYTLWRLVQDAYLNMERHRIPLEYDEYKQLLRSQTYNLASFGYTLEWEQDEYYGSAYLSGEHNTTKEFLYLGEKRM